MRLAALTLTILLASAASALAAPPVVTVTIGPELMTKAEKTYGVRDVERLADDLRQGVERAAAREGAHSDARIELVLTDAVPNRPTFKQLGDTPGLSMESFGVGGAAITGKLVAADGTETHLAYKWYETDIRQAYGHWVWWDAQTTMSRFASRLARGQKLAAR